MVIVEGTAHIKSLEFLRRLIISRISATGVFYIKVFPDADVLPVLKVSQMPL